MAARAQCPHCGAHLTVRTDDRLPGHWEYPGAHLAGDPRCPGSASPTRYWPTRATPSGPIRVQRTPKETATDA